MALSIGIENLGHPENIDLEKEKRAFLALGIAEALLRYKHNHLIDKDQYSVAMFGVDVKTGLEESNQNVRAVDSFVKDIGNKDNEGADISFIPSKNSHIEPLEGKIASFSKQEFIPVVFDIQPGRNTLAVENWYGRLLVAVEIEDDTVQVPFFNTHSWIAPSTKPDRRKKTPDPQELRVVPFDTSYSQVEFGDEVHGRNIDTQARPFDPQNADIEDFLR